MTTAQATSRAQLTSAPPVLRLTRGYLRCRVVDNIIDLADLRDRWDRVVDEAGAGVAMTYDWCRTWWHYYGQGRDARIFLFHDEQDVVGVLPMYVHQLTLGPARLRIAALMGSDSTQSLCDVPICRRWAGMAMHEVFRRLLVDERCDLIQFGPATDESGTTGMLETACGRNRPIARLFRSRVITQNTVITLPPSYDAYLNSLSRNQRSNLRKDWKRLRADSDVRFDFITDADALRSEFDALVGMHRQQWRHRGNLGHFNDWPDAAAFNRSLISAMSDTGRVLFVRMRANGRVVARQCSFIYGDTCHCRFAARSADPRWSRYGPGRLILVRLFEHLIERGIRRVDAGTGRYDYKLRLGGVEHPVRSTLIAADRAGVGPRARLFCAASDLLDRVYYKTWRYRIAPRLGLPARPLRKAWIRSRL